MIFRFSCLVITVLFSFWAADARADCQLSIGPAKDVHIRNYNGFETGAAVEELGINLVNSGSSICKGAFSLVAYGGNSSLRHPNGEKLQYLIAQNRGFNGLLFDSASQIVERLNVMVPPESSIFLNPAVVVPPHQSGPAGLYETEIVAKFHDNDMAQPEQDVVINISVDLIPVVQANFAGLSRNGSVSTLDLGELRPGLTRRFGLQLRSNSVVDMEITSENAGQLKHVTEADAGVPYELSIAGQPINLATPNSMNAPANLATDGITNPMQLKIKNFENAVAGDYTDTIRVRISAR